MHVQSHLRALDKSEYFLFQVSKRNARTGVFIADFEQIQRNIQHISLCFYVKLSTCVCVLGKSGRV